MPEDHIPFDQLITSSVNGFILLCLFLCCSGLSILDLMFIGVYILDY